ncbi:TPA: hypothetical protein DDZ10_02350 [Candidatus Uhrbacteria bacterium]|uniref:HAD family hydrolase n=1 Tax=Candidatus Uhrbacteria bacterium GW2011_GWC2_53_7 TaxID=1618986 RepID=A0A0G1XVJ6_9BACT|nr:MAG: hypothetical protein UY82_C0046G0010 [Candidatus Uhrbacteria bacterium GW2011_GWC2_53_7]OGL71892.1 MAG: hypothetical protein A3D69_03165 [Candidatus Uhrbacteria bacterium RIFCSPHIGHO2_02_FULL_54_11]HBL39489.1 hypothetical protein [Candidatus Uhrbacteria bacterium]
MKRIIFFDGDGTLWYPKTTKHTRKPHWIYHDPTTMNDPLSHLAVIPGVKRTLRELQRRGILTVLISTHPHTKKDADQLLQEKVRHFKLDSLFNEVHSSRLTPTGKGTVIKRVLKQRHIPKTRALMIGDSYIWDYRSAKDAGIDAVLIDTAYLRARPGTGKVKQRIKSFSEILALPFFHNHKQAL